MDILFLVLYAAYPELALLGYWGLLGEHGKSAVAHFAIIVGFVFVSLLILLIFVKLYDPVRAY